MLPDLPLLAHLPPQEGRAIALALFYRPSRFELLWVESRSRALLAALRFQDSYGLDQVRATA